MRLSNIPKILKANALMLTLLFIPKQSTCRECGPQPIRRTMKGKTMKRTIFTLIGAVAMAALFTLPIQPIQAGQTENETRLTLDTNWLVPPPVAIEKMWRNHEAIAPGTPFNGYEGWLQDFKVRVKNTSTSAIKYLELVVYVPAKDQDRNFYIPEHKLMAGNNYFQSRQAKSEQAELLLRPNETVDIMFHPHNYGIFAAQARKAPPAALRSIKLKVGAVVFEDLETCWFRGMYMKRESNGSWKPDRERISSILPRDSRQYQRFLLSLNPPRSPKSSKASGFARNLTGRQTQCWSLDTIDHTTCRGEACGTGCIFDDWKLMTFASGWPKLGLCASCYLGIFACSEACKMSDEQIDYENSCP